MKIPKNLKPMWATVVFPDEYDLDRDMIEAVEMANSCETSRGKILVPCDIGKLVGLYLAYKNLLETYEDNSG